MTETTETKKLTWEEALEYEPWVAPLIDIYETDENFYLIAQMPGVTKDNIKIKLENGHLVIMGRIDYDSHVNRKYVLKEIESGNFYRKFKISDNINTDKIDAKLENGLLEVTLPKQEKIRPRRIDIK
ncbi:Hsp20/alpha crystallin family protein [Melioribacteraceae bacterium 4301-Me]|uniref:Hsp20/alpha crystallin family protein n=1 Tax=Pyranulibacter aquaticus TaxID=3163344 RepID=UPI00359A5E63